MLWADVRDGWAARSGQQPSFAALQDAVEDVFNARIGDVSGRGRLAGDMRETWLMQPRFEKRVGSGPYGMIDQPRFRAAFDFMRLRADAGEVDQLIADWWQEFTTGSDDQREDLLAQAREEQARRQKPVRVPRVVPVASAGAVSDAAPQTDTDAAPKKRRRRRKPSGGGAGAAPGSDA